jgi:heme-degrading monooxygenase HmoA
MYSSVTTFQVQPDKVDELIRIYEEASQALPGLQGLKDSRLLTDRSTGKGLVVAVWETEADIKAFENNPVFREAMAGLQSILSAPPSREYYEVSSELKASS